MSAYPVEMASLDEITRKFAGVDDELRLELLLDYAKRLPALPPEYEARKAAGENRVPECMTPVFLWMDADDGVLHMHVDVAEEAPTVKGILSIVVEACEGRPPVEAANLPDDLLQRLHLTNVIRMNRALGLRAIVGRIRRRAGELRAEAGSATP